MAISVIELNNKIKDKLTASFSNKLEVEGEISNLKISNNSLFFTLKDSESSISCVWWQADRTVKMSNGDKIVLTGKLTCFTKSGTYNITVNSVKLNGLGQIHQDYERLKEFYKSNGYFDKKKDIPSYVKNLCIITSPDGAALQDILFVLNKNNFNGKVTIKKSLVQGKDCPRSVSSAIQEMDKLNFDIILIARGGGSLEDLYGYSDSKIIESLYNCKTFTMSAIGHEIDFMLSDFAADYRAPTPSIAGEVISNLNINYNKNYLNLADYLSNKLNDKIQNKINNYNLQLNLLLSKLPNPVNLIENNISNLNNLSNFFNDKIHNKLTSITQQIQIYDNKINNYNHDKMLNIGYSLLLSKYKLITTLKDLENLIEKELPIKIKLSDGEIEVVIKKK